jgi:hypothetical protein
MTWPELTLSEWDDTRVTLHLWTQVVGKVRLALEPMVNHWWQIALYVSARGLTTSLMPAGDRGLEIEFDFVDHCLHLRTSDGGARDVILEPKSVATFYRETMSALGDLDVDVTIRHPSPTEVPFDVPFADDEEHAAYDADAAHRFWLALVNAQRVMQQFRARFDGKASPVHFFWGGADLATTRFSGRTAPPHPGGVPNCPDWVQRLAYSHEVHSCGFWPGGSEEGSFYAYGYPTPDGFADARIEPDAAFFDQTYREFLLPYADVRKADDPDAMVLAFFQSTFDAVAERGKWDL